MKIGLLGTGMVAETLATKLTALGHPTLVGARTADSDSLVPFKGMPGVETGSFADAARFGELLINATSGLHSVAALELAVADQLGGKPLLDVANELDTSVSPPSLAGPNNSLAMKIQNRFPNLRVVKSLNTMNCHVMVEPSLAGLEHVAFLSGDDAAAKNTVRALLNEFGWRDDQILDLGGIDSAASAEMLMHIWLRIFMARGGPGTPPFNFAISSADS
ncbi:MAG: NAD(P)-binding domain-containing protein [Solirubrobacterales bacterium]